MSNFARIDGVSPGTSLPDVESFFRKKGVAVKSVVQYYESIDTEGNPSLVVTVKFESPEARKMAICTANGKKINAQGKSISISPAYFGSIGNLDDRTEEEDIVEFFRKSRISNMVDCMLSRDDCGASVGEAEIVFSDKTGLDKAVKEITGKRIYKDGNAIRIAAANPTKNLSAISGQVKLSSSSDIKSKSSELPTASSLAVKEVPVTKSRVGVKSNIIAKAPGEIIEGDAQPRRRSSVSRPGLLSLTEIDGNSAKAQSTKDLVEAQAARKPEARRQSTSGNSTAAAAVASARNGGSAACEAVPSKASTGKTAVADIKRASSSDSNGLSAESPSVAKSQPAAKQAQVLSPKLATSTVTATASSGRTSSPTKTRSSKSMGAPSGRTASPTKSKAAAVALSRKSFTHSGADISRTGSRGEQSQSKDGTTTSSRRPLGEQFFASKQPPTPPVPLTVLDAPGKPLPILFSATLPTGGPSLAAASLPAVPGAPAPVALAVPAAVSVPMPWSAYTFAEASADTSERSSISSIPLDAEEPLSGTRTRAVKVSIQPGNHLRGFSVSGKADLSAIAEQLRGDYGRAPKLSYSDPDGDEVDILAESDFEYVLAVDKNPTLRIKAVFPESVIESVSEIDSEVESGIESESASVASALHYPGHEREQLFTDNNPSDTDIDAADSTNNIALRMDLDDGMTGNDRSADVEVASTASAYEPSPFETHSFTAAPPGSAVNGTVVSADTAGISAAPSALTDPATATATAIAATAAATVVAVLAPAPAAADTVTPTTAASSANRAEPAEPSPESTSARIARLMAMAGRPVALPGQAVAIHQLGSHDFGSHDFGSYDSDHLTAVRPSVSNDSEQAIAVNRSASNDSDRALSSHGSFDVGDIESEKESENEGEKETAVSSYIPDSDDDSDYGIGGGELDKGGAEGAAEEKGGAEEGGGRAHLQSPLVESAPTVEKVEKVSVADTTSSCSSSEIDFMGKSPKAPKSNTTPDQSPKPVDSVQHGVNLPKPSPSPSPLRNIESNSAPALVPPDLTKRTVAAGFNPSTPLNIVQTGVFRRLTRALVINSAHGCSAEALLRGINEIVGNTANELIKQRGPAHPMRTVYTVGRTGVGKSTFIAYMLGFPLHRVKEGRKNVWNYLTRPDTPHPTIGGGTSETKGCHFYRLWRGDVDYVDCAGTMDRGGVDQDICNAVSLSMAMRERPFSSMLVLVKTSDITEKRGGGFLDLIKRMSRCTRSENFEDAWSRFVFVVNDKVRNSEDEIVKPEEGKEILLEILGDLAKNESKEVSTIMKTYLPDATKIVGQALASKLHSASLATFNFFADKMRDASLRKPQDAATAAGGGDAAGSEGEEAAEESSLASLFSLLPADKRGKLDECKFNIRFIDWLRRHPSNFIVSDIGDSGQTRFSIEQQVRAVSTVIQPQAFVPECLYEETVRDPRGAVQELTNGIVELVAGKISEFRDKLHRVKRTQAEVNHFSIEMLELKVDDLNKNKDQIESHVKFLEGRIAEEMANIAGYNTEIDELSDDDTCVFLTSVKPAIPIEPRTVFGFESVATKYAFDYRTPYLEVEGHVMNIPIVKVEEVAGSAMRITGKKAAEFSDRELKPEEGIYKSMYLPAYYGFQEDIDTVVNIFVHNRHHPKTLWLLKNLQNKKSLCESAIEAAQLRLSRYRETSELVDAQCTERLQELSEEMALTKTVDGDCSEAAYLLEELQGYRAVCLTLMEIEACLTDSMRRGKGDAGQEGGKPSLGPSLHSAAWDTFASFMRRLQSFPEGAMCNKGHNIFPHWIVAAGDDEMMSQRDPTAVEPWTCCVCSEASSGLEGLLCLQCGDSICIRCCEGGEDEEEDDDDDGAAAGCDNKGMDSGGGTGDIDDEDAPHPSLGRLVLREGGRGR